MNPTKSCTIVGAGLSGLIAATLLEKHGFQVTVIEKAKGVGGRLATRRIDEAVFDHGAQYFTGREAEFQALITQWSQARLIEPWATGFFTGEGFFKETGETRYRGAAGMTTLPKALAQGLKDVRLNQRVTAIEVDEAGWQLTFEDQPPLKTDALLLTPPVPQSIALLDEGNVRLPNDIRSQLTHIQYAPCFALMVQLESPSRIPAPGGLWLNGDPISWIADNQRKGISTVPAVTIHAGFEFSTRYFDAESETVAHLLLEAAQQWIGSSTKAYQLHRWRYSIPTVTHPHPYLLWRDHAPLMFAGDAFAGPRVEGAALSGMAAAQEMKELLA